MADDVPPWLQSLPLAPEFSPSEDEFADPIAYISKIEPDARSYGICKIIPPFPPVSKKTVMANLNRSLLRSWDGRSPDSLDARGSASSPHLPSSELDSAPPGGCFMTPPFVSTTSCDLSLPSMSKNASSTCIDADSCGLKAMFTARRQQLGRLNSDFAQKLAWENGDRYTLEQFEAKAAQFARVRFQTTHNPPPLSVEALFWKAAAGKPITVEYGNGISGSAFEMPSTNGSSTSNGTFDAETPCKESKVEFPRTDACFQNTAEKSNCHSAGKRQARPNYVGACSISTKDGLRRRRRSGLRDTDGLRLANSKWNMRVLPRAQGSLLRYMPNEIPGVTTPMVYIGMLFSWFAWHVEDHELHSANYLHTGAPKSWYAVPGDAAPALEEVIRVYGYGDTADPQVVFSSLCEKTTMMSPELLVAAGVPCCRLVQNAGEFVITFPRAYHLGFSHGFNCGESANFASPSWLEVAKDAATRRALMNYLPMLSHQQLLYLSAFSISPRIPLANSFEYTSSLSEDRRTQLLGEDSVKNAFVNDIAHINRLLGFLLDTGITGCIVLRDDIDFPFVSSREIKHSSDNCTTSCCVMRLNGYCETTDSDYLHQNSVHTKTQKYQSSVNTMSNKCCTLQEESRICRPHFRLDTLPCAACGVLCFPTMAIVKPASVVINDSESKKHYRKSSLEQFAFAGTDETHPLATTNIPTINRSVNEGDGTFVDVENRKETFICEITSKLMEFDDPLQSKQKSHYELLTTEKMVIDSLSSHEWTEKVHHFYSETGNSDDGDAVTIKGKNHIMEYSNGVIPLVNDEKNLGTYEPVFQDLLPVLDPSMATFQNVVEGPVRKDIYRPHSSLVSDEIDRKMDVSSMDMRQHAQSLVKDTSIEMKPLKEPYKFACEEALKQSNDNTFTTKDYASKIKEHMPMHHKISAYEEAENSELECEEMEIAHRPCKALVSLLPTRNSELTKGKSSVSTVEEPTNGLPLCVNVFHDPNVRIRCDNDESKANTSLEYFAPNNQNFCMMNTGNGNCSYLSCIVALAKANPGTVSCKQENCRDSSNQIHISEKSTIHMELETQIPEEINECESDTRLFKGLDVHQTLPLLTGKEPSGSSFVNGQSESLQDSLPSETELRPFVLCLEHALEARSRLKSSGGSYVVLFCHSDMTEMEQRAKSFAEELSLSYSWRRIPFREASSIEQTLLKTALDVACNKERTDSDWLSGLGMTVLHNGNRVLLHEYGNLYEHPWSSLMVKERNYNNQRTVTDSKDKCKGIRDSDASGTISKQKMISVAGQWCGKVWRSSQVHPILGGCRSSSRILNLSSGEDSINCRKQVYEDEETYQGSPKSTHSVSLKSAMERIGEMNHTSRYTGLELETPMSEKLIREQEFGSACREKDYLSLAVTLKGSEKSKKEDSGVSNDVVSFPSSAATVGGRKRSASSRGSFDDNEFLPIVPNIIGLEEVQMRGTSTVNDGGSDSDIWQGINDVSDQKKIIPSNVSREAEGPYLVGLVTVPKGAGTQILDNLLLPVIMRRRTCSIFDGRISVHTLSPNVNCTESQRVVCNLRETQQSAVGPGMIKDSKYPTIVDRMQDHLCPPQEKSKEDSYGSVKSFSKEIHDALSFEYFGNYAETSSEHNDGARPSPACLYLGNENTNQNLRPCMSGASRNGLLQRACRPLEFVTKKSRSLNGKWRSMKGDHNNSRSLIQCSNMSMAGKRSHMQLQEQEKSEFTGSSNDEMVQKIPRKKFVTNGRCYEGHVTGGPSTRLRPRNAAKLIVMEEEEIPEVQEHARKVPKPRQSRRKKMASRDAEDDDFGGYYCDIEGCTMTFDTKQELNMHKRNACTYAGCGKRFGTHKYLLQHRRVHLDDRPLKCPWTGCPMTFKWKWACTEHYRVHTGERPYVCPVSDCGRSFRFVSDFSRHKRKTGHAK